ncbi:hypothetical protein WJX79_008154 [Trebouxia sp. C0005]
MTWKLHSHRLVCPPAVLGYIFVVCLVIVFCAPAQGYEDPGISDRDLRIYNNGTLSFSVAYQNWTGYWTTQTTIAAGVLLLDEAGEIWYSGSDVVIQVAPLNESSVDRRMLSLSDPAMYQNVYESVSSLSGDCGASSACCTDDSGDNFQYDLNFNATEYIAYTVTAPSTLVDPYQFGDYDPNYFGLQIDNWQGSRSEDCVNPLGYYTWYLGPVFEETPYFTDWDEGSTPFPETATVNDSYNQLAWYENNMWAAYAGKLQLTPDARFQRNTIAANIPANGQVNCSMLYNVPSATPELVTNGSSATFMAIVNTAQAVVCEYPNNVMMVTATIPAETFNFAKATLGLLSNGSQAYWYPVVGPPISFTVYFDLFWPSVDRLTYMSPYDTSLNSVDKTPYTEFSGGAGQALQSSANLIAPGAQVSMGPLPPGAAAAFSTGTELQRPDCGMWNTWSAGLKL